MNFATSFKHNALALACAGVIAALAGCGGGDDPAPTQTNDPAPAPVTPPPVQPSSQIKGTAMAGRFLSGEVCAYKLAAGKQGDKIACSSFDANSQFNIDAGAYAGEVLLSIESGASYDDEATQGDESYGTPLKGSLRSIVAVKGGQFTVAITPFTEAAVRMASPLSLAAIQEKAQILLGLLPLESSFDLLNTQPSQGHTDAQQMLYREILRALSQMQADAKMQGDLGNYLNMLVDHITHGSDTDKENLKNQIVAAIRKGLDSSYCVLKDARLSCQTTPLPVVALSCKTELFQAGAAVSLPGSMDIVQFSGPYSGAEGVYDNNLNFTRTGDAQLLFSTDAKAIYNGVEYPLSSLCMETNATYGKMFYLHFAGHQAHIDLFSNRSWSGVSPKDGVTIIKGDKPATTPPGDGGGTQPGASSNVSFSIPINGFTGVQGASPVFKQSVTTTGFDRREWKWTVGSDMNQLSLIVVHSQSQGKDSEVLEIAVGGGLPHFSARVNDIIGMCTLGYASSNSQVKECSTLGVSFDKKTGAVGFNKTPMATIIGTPAKFTLSGSAGFAPF